MQTPYRQIPSLLRSLSPFQGNTMSAQIETVEREGDALRAYVVRSYGTIIATVPMGDTLAAAWINPRRYSQTTSRQQNLCRAAFAYA